MTGEESDLVTSDIRKILCDLLTDHCYKPTAFFSKRCILLLECFCVINKKKTQNKNNKHNVSCIKDNIHAGYPSLNCNQSCTVQRW